MEPLLSILLPVYNAEQYLAEAIASVCVSTFTCFELLCIDDGSTDNSSAIIHNFMKKDARIRLIQLDHGGIVAALNAGIRAAQADFIARMDSDDICRPERFVLQYNELVTHTEISLISCLVKPFSTAALTEGTVRYFQWVNRSISHTDMVRDLHIESPIIHPSVMFRKSSVIRLGGYRAYDGPEDYDLWLRMAEMGMQFSKVRKELLHYRIHDTNLSKTDMLHYHGDAFLKRKCAFVANRLKAGKIGDGRKLRICGFARAGKKLYTYLEKQHIPVDAFVDIVPNRINTRYKNTVILSADTIGTDDETIFYICLIRKWGAPEELRTFFSGKGKIEGIDYLLL